MLRCVTLTFIAFLRISCESSRRIIFYGLYTESGLQDIIALAMYSLLIVLTLGYKYGILMS